MKLSLHKNLFPTLDDLKEPLTLQQGMVVSDAYGGQKTHWQDQGQIWGKVDPLVPAQPDERWEAAQGVAAGRYWIWIRQETQLARLWRLKWEDKFLTLRAVPIPLGKSYWLLLMEWRNETA